VRTPRDEVDLGSHRTHSLSSGSRSAPSFRAPVLRRGSESPRSPGQPSCPQVGSESARWHGRPALGERPTPKDRRHLTLTFVAPNQRSQHLHQQHLRLTPLLQPSLHRCHFIHRSRPRFLLKRQPRAVPHGRLDPEGSSPRRRACSSTARGCAGSPSDLDSSGGVLSVPREKLCVLTCLIRIDHQPVSTCPMTTRTSPPERSSLKQNGTRPLPHPISRVGFTTLRLQVASTQLTRDSDNTNSLSHEASSEVATAPTSLSNERCHGTCRFGTLAREPASITNRLKCCNATPPASPPLVGRSYSGVPLRALPFAILPLGWHQTITRRDRQPDQHDEGRAGGRRERC
jgi:hypothetical protein